VVFAVKRRIEKELTKKTEKEKTVMFGSDDECLVL